ncbi:MAG: hypothetical protein QOH60_3218 [Mycobacterium sp.]|nr:hypothetical protein [Mycobacterium sp.]
MSSGQPPPSPDAEQPSDDATPKLPPSRFQRGYVRADSKKRQDAPASQPPQGAPSTAPQSPQSRFQAGHVRAEPWTTPPAPQPPPAAAPVPSSYAAPTYPAPQPPIPVTRSQPHLAGPGNAAQQPVPPVQPSPPSRALVEARHLAATLGSAAVRYANPIRAAFAALTIAGLVLFFPNFLGIRLDDRWPWEGWLCRGGWPVVWLLAGVVLVAIGALGIRIWTYDKWQNWRQQRRAKNFQPPAPPRQPAQVG